MKTRIHTFAVILLFAGWIAAELKLGAAGPAATTDAPRVVHAGATNEGTIPDFFTVRLDAETQTNLIRAIQEGGKRTGGSLQVVLTNVNPVILHSTVTNPINFPNTVAVTLGESTIASLSPHPEASWKKLLPLISTLVGAIIALFGGYWATTRSHKLQVARQREQDAEFVRRLKACLTTELDMLGQFYANGIGKDLSDSQTPQPLRVRFALTEKWFTVFEANANHLAKLNEQESASIIKIYGFMKSMVEYFRINNLILDQLDPLEKHIAEVLHDERAEVRRNHILRQMTQLAAMLKDLESKLKQEIDHFNSIQKTGL